MRPDASIQHNYHIHARTDQVDELSAATVMTAAMVDAAFVATAAQAKPLEADPFRKGDFVVYPAHGVGKVDRVGSTEIAGIALTEADIQVYLDRRKPGQ